MPWKILMQEETVGRNKIPVECKNVRLFPIEGKSGNVEGFGRLGFLLLQVMIENEHGTVLRLKLNASGGIDNPKFVVQQPDRMEHPTWIVGCGKNRRRVPDWQSPKERKPGEKEEFDTPEDFSGRLLPMVGAEMAGTILSLFAQRFASLAAKKAAKKG